MPYFSNTKFEDTERFITNHLKNINNPRKPVLAHDIRVGLYLYERKYSDDIVLASLLHDILEFSEVTEDDLTQKYSQNVIDIIKANTKDDTIRDPKSKTDELIKRCIENGENALIVKTADIMDSFKYYTGQNNIEQLKYCMRNANAIMKHKPENFNDKIFEELTIWQKCYSNLTE